MAGTYWVSVFPDSREGREIQTLMAVFGVGGSAFSYESEVHSGRRIKCPVVLLGFLGRKPRGAKRNGQLF